MSSSRTSRDMRSACGKQPHASRGAAQAQVRSVLERGLDTAPGRELRAYLCVRCSRVNCADTWHAGHGDSRTRVMR